MAGFINTFKTDLQEVICNQYTIIGAGLECASLKLSDRYFQVSERQKLRHINIPTIIAIRPEA
jgi:hypothetical protein